MKIPRVRFGEKQPFSHDVIKTRRSSLLAVIFWGAVMFSGITIASSEAQARRGNATFVSSITQFHLSGLQGCQAERRPIKQRRGLLDAGVLIIIAREQKM
ncbi:MAG: hypothetical protein CL798_07320 [Chromatiales bacterium]|nr:hypothetical protein [Chromatiales bacterium]